MSDKQNHPTKIPFDIMSLVGFARSWRGWGAKSNPVTMNKYFYALILGALCVVGCVVGVHWCAVHIDKPHFILSLLSGLTITILSLMGSCIYKLLK